MFHDHLDYLSKSLLGGRSNTKSRDHGILHAHNCWFILFIMCDDPREKIVNEIAFGWRPSHIWLHTTLEGPWRHYMILEVSWDGLWTLCWALTISWSRLLARVWSGPKSSWFAAKLTPLSTTTTFMVFSVTYFLELQCVIMFYYKSHFFTNRYQIGYLGTI